LRQFNHDMRRRGRAIDRGEEKDMAVRSSEPTTSSRRKDTAMLSGAAIDRGAVRWMQIGAWLILFGSFAGSVAAFNGGWAPVLADKWHFWRGIDPLAAGVGVTLQVIITWTEWHNRHKKTGAWYLLALLIDVILTFVGYDSLLSPFFASGMIRLTHGSTAAIVGSLLTLVLSVVVAIFPETVLVD